MNDTKVLRELAEIKSLLSLNDLVTEDEAAKALGIKKVSLQNKVYEGKLTGCFEYDVLGHRLQNLFKQSS